MWKRDLGMTFTPVDLDKICSGIFPKCTSISIHKQKFKFFQRTYYTPIRLQRMFPDTSYLCYKCNTYKGVFGVLGVTTFRLSGRVFTLWFRKSLVKSFYWLVLFTYSTMLQTIFLYTETKSLVIILLFLAKEMYLSAVVNSPGPYCWHVDIRNIRFDSSRETHWWP